MKLRIGILGTRGIPNYYGGFEYFTEHLSQGLAKRGHEIFVYNSHNHPNQQKLWNHVNIIHCYDPEYRMGSFGQFVYDLNCVRDARKRKFDIMLFLGYTSSSIWGWLYPKDPVIIYNMDGFEWQRSKYSKATQMFLKRAEKLAIRYSDFFVADSIYIQAYLKEKYHLNAEYIAYGADLFTCPDEQILSQYNLKKNSYNMLMARMEPENNIEVVLDGYHSSKSDREFIVVGNTGNKFGAFLKKKFAGDKRIRFTGAIFNQEHINNLMYFSNLYFHGHSVGGTNPSLLEAMSSNTLVIAQNNVFNKAVLQSNAYYFDTAAQVTEYANSLCKNGSTEEMIAANASKIEKEYSWNKVIGEYESFFLDCHANKS